jgi:hypothetical protein
MDREIQEVGGSVEAKQMQIYVSATHLKFKKRCSTKA